MSIKDLVPKMTKGRGDSALARRRPEDSMLSFQKEMNRLFDEFFGDFADFGLAPLGGWRERGLAVPVFEPRVDVAESDKEVRLTAELPGMDEKDVTVEVEDETVTIRGERRQEQEHKGRHWYRREQSYGAFHRVVPLPAAIRTEQAKARFSKGVLSVTAPKQAAGAPKRKAIPIESD